MRGNAQDMDIDACMELVNAMVKQMFEELKAVANSETVSASDRLYKINDVIRLEFEICDNKFTKYVLSDVTGTVEQFLKVVCPLEQKENNNYKIRDKRTGVCFISYLSFENIIELKERSYLEITKIKEG